MALIKCLECGKEVSDRASSCPNCGCPLEQKSEVKSKDDNYANIQNIPEKEIFKATFDYKLFNAIITFFIIIMVIEVIVFLAIGIGSGIFGVLVFDMLWFGFCYVIFDSVKQASLVLTNKRIHGKESLFFITKEIDIPLNQVSSISKTRFFGSNALVIEASGSTRKRIEYVDNADEFRDKVIKEIQKYRKI